MNSKEKKETDSSWTQPKRIAIAQCMLYAALLAFYCCILFLQITSLVSLGE